MIPAQPSILLPRPFANNGIFQVIPDDKAVDGRASFKEGFPVETQLPLNNGGIAPNRMDFNGILHTLSAFAFWQQSGGQWSWSPTLNYQKPCMVYHNDVLWWCVQGSGPATADGPKTPGSSPDHWLDFASMISLMATESGGSIGSPVGSLAFFPKEPVPAGYFECDGGKFSATKYPKLYSYLGSTNLPDYNGLFLRARDPNATNDPDGKTRELGSQQGDAIRNIKGQFNPGAYWPNVGASGVFYSVANGSREATDASNGAAVVFDASRQVPTAEENRPKNKSVIVAIKHD